MKKYLETPEEVVDALKMEKEVFTENGRTYLDKDSGISITKWNKGGWGINSYIDSSNAPYIEVEDPKPEIKLEVGKYYVNRSHQIVLCAYKFDSGKFVVVLQCDGHCYDVSDDGTNQNRYLDIVGEFREEEEEHADND